MDHREHLPIGAELVGNYRIDGMLGQGGFGVTYAATDLTLGKTVAIKEYFPTEFATRDNTMSVRPQSERHGDMYEWGRKRFLDEAKTLAQFRHPAIVRVQHFFNALNTGYMVLEHEDGQSLGQWLEELGRPATQAELDEIVPPLLDALEVMHAADFIHRDIAPDNIIVRPDGSPVLLDFGAARQAIAAQSKTLTGIVKVGYSPPEQYLSEPGRQGPWTDIYALGATLYYVVTGAAPPESPARQMGETYVSAAVASRGKYNPALLSAIDRALQLGVAERPQSIAQFRDTTGNSQRVPETAAASSQSQPQVRNRTSPLKWVAALVLIVAAIGGYVVYDQLELKRQRERAMAAAKAEGRIEVLVGLPARQQTRWLRPGAGKVEGFKDCQMCPEMVVVPGGTFQMGLKGAGNRANPVHTVTIAKPFAVGQFEVTFAQWDACVADNGCKHKPTDKDWGRGRHPVINVSWTDATQYVAWLSGKTGKRYRLLSEAEWEYVARAGTSTPYWWGSAVTMAQANFNSTETYGYGHMGKYRKRTVKVGSFEPNPWGLFQVHGNAEEWVADCWHGSYRGAPTNGAAWSNNCEKDPVFGTMNVRVLRGGSWFSLPIHLRSANRSRFKTGITSAHIGFRIGRTL